MNQLFEPLSFCHGLAMTNRFMLAPMTSQQSNADGSCRMMSIDGW
jgi:2,4-dienoyl-CoA reductase-like NADH-dependent reductase (Old Yellow Enzyme family)